MASFRRSLSPAINDRAVPNGSVIPLSPTHTSNLTFFGVDLAASVSTSITICDSLSSYGALLCCPLSWFRIPHRQGVYERSKFKGHVWKKPFLHIILCFFLGFLLGLTPFSWPNLSTSTHALELKGFPTYLQREIVSHDGRERQLEAVRPGNPAGRGLDSGRYAENHRSGFPTFSGQIPGPYAQVQVSDSGSRKLLIIITPTYNRPFQALYLTRLSHTLKLVPPPLLWLVVEMHGQTMETAGILRRTGVMYRHIVCDKNATDVKDRGVHQRNVALAHIEQHQLDGVVYFADDDNVYTLELFEQMRKIKRFGTWPVGMLVHSKSKAILEGPVCDGEKVIGWHTNEKSKRLRRFHVDMCGFGFNSTILWDPHRWRKLTPEPIRQLDNVKEGFQETTFIEQLVEDESQMEGFPDGCSKVLVWHLHLEAPGLIYPSGWTLQDNLNATISFPGQS